MTKEKMFSNPNNENKERVGLWSMITHVKCKEVYISSVYRLYTPHQPHVRVLGQFNAPYEVPSLEDNLFPVPVAERARS